MKIINTRQELAMAMNFGKHPVLTIDLADADEYGLKGCKVRIDAGTFRDGEPYIINATLRVYRDACKLTTSSAGTCLHADFSFTDYFEMAEYAAAPIIKPDQEVVVAIYDSKNKTAFAAVKVRTSKSVRRDCSTPITFEDNDMSAYIMAAGMMPGSR